ncbi:phosphopantetheine-binding protein [Corallococcus llansteffanensis]|nr:phosphopantetheine-binding protein [Corallococcus llansteffanensis]
MKRVRAGMAAPPDDGAELASLGIDSMDIITILTNLEKRAGLDFDRIVGLTPPKTLEDLLTMVEGACA